ncbi:MAG: pantoate--beta-alanine ligase [Verrucomicrobiales bacterium]|nr:pantoate--beta-alanine ligase [Verrucomicrobiales bacterium]
MQIIQRLDEFREWSRQNRTVQRALVPTMGALHEGHLSLCDRAREEVGAGGHVVATVFVNPTQFGPNEDLDAYPRQLEEDAKACEKRGVDVLFAPNPADMYFPDASVEIHENVLSTGLCGASRPGHFTGVCTVVAKLFNLAQPDVAVFGEKDFQQLAVIRRMVRDLNFPVQIVGGNTVRESDGLAMSSRNLYLTDAERTQAPVIYRSLCEVRDGIADGPVKSPQDAIAMLEAKIGSAAPAKIDYLQCVHPETLEPLNEFGEGGYRLIVAVFFGKPRLIDNLGPV